jgi:hypothetical protein
VPLPPILFSRRGGSLIAIGAAVSEEKSADAIGAMVAGCLWYRLNWRPYMPLSLVRVPGSCTAPRNLAAGGPWFSSPSSLRPCRRHLHASLGAESPAGAGERRDRVNVRSHDPSQWPGDLVRGIPFGPLGHPSQRAGHRCGLASECSGGHV